MSNSEVKRVVILVDSRKRDLPVATLIAYHLEKNGVKCFLQPLESYKSVLSGIKPHMIVFNHLTASHLAEYSQRLHLMGVLTAVLPNEGIMYDKDDLAFNSGRFHSNAHIDCYFCWNEGHRDSLIEQLGQRIKHIVVVGVPRFDFYAKPWSLRYLFRKKVLSSRKQVLLCTNFQVAKFWELPREEGDKFFSAWKSRIPLYNDYWVAIEENYKARNELLPFLDALLKDERFDLLLRPHPREDASVYYTWFNGLATQFQSRVLIDCDTEITELILQCDIEVSCETCTTALESWIAHKPTVELIFARNPLWFHENHAAANLLCDSSLDFVETIDSAMTNPEESILSYRKKHLKIWCFTDDGKSSERVATTIIEAVQTMGLLDWKGLTWRDKLRGIKLRILNVLDKPYHYNPLRTLRYRFNPQGNAIKQYAYEKAITPSQVNEARESLLKIDFGQP